MVYGSRSLGMEMEVGMGFKFYFIFAIYKEHVCANVGDKNAFGQVKIVSLMIKNDKMS